MIRIFILLISLSAFFASCKDEHVTENKKEWEAVDTLQVTERLFESQITYTDSGYLRAKLFADLIERHSNATKPFVELPKGLRAEFYNTKKEVESELTAGYGINYIDSKIVEVRKNVVVVNSKGETLKTEKLYWDQNTKEIYTDADDSVTIITDKEEIYGRGLRAAQDFSAWTIKQVTGTVSINN